MVLCTQLKGGKGIRGSPNRCTESGLAGSLKRGRNRFPRMSLPESPSCFRGFDAAFGG